MTDISMVSKLDGNGIVVEWTKLKTPGNGSFGPVHFVKLSSMDSDMIVKCFSDVVKLEKGVTIYNLFLEYAFDGSLPVGYLNPSLSVTPRCY
ncbi:hypothetical protein V6N13_010085 [Hibiscus sabdariffa]